MREVFKWDKDYRTGETKTVKALKPSDVVGKVKIELRNKDGELVREVHSENLIPPAFYMPSVYRDAYRDIAFGSVGGGSTSSNLKYLSEAFHSIVLKDDDREESIDNRFCKGDVIGYCPREDQNAGSSSLRGVYNPIESFTENKGSFYHAHRVYDFNTAQGNGTFNSIWWTRRINDRSGVNNLCAFDIYSPPVTDSGTISAIYRNYKGEYFKYKDDKYYKILNDIREVVNTGYMKLDVNSVGAFTWPTRTFEDGKKYVGVKTSTTNDTRNFNKILTLEVRNIVDEEVLKTYTLNFRELFTDIVECADNCNVSNSYKRFGGSVFAVDNEGNCLIDVFCRTRNSYESSSNQGGYFVFSHSNGKYYTYIYLRGVFNVNTGNWVIYPRLNDPRCEELHNVTLDSVNYNTSAFSMRKFGEDLIMTTNHYNDRFGVSIFVFEGGLTGNIYATSTAYSVQAYNNSTSYMPNLIGFYVPECDVYLPFAETNYNYVYKLSYPYSAHTKLPKPVTKTSADTMKIIYDYYIQIPWAFEANGNHVPDLSIPQD